MGCEDGGSHRFVCGEVCGVKTWPGEVTPHGGQVSVAQEAVRLKRFRVERFRGASNPADLLTKPKSIEDMKSMLRDGCVQWGSRVRRVNGLFRRRGRAVEEKREVARARAKWGDEENAREERLDEELKRLLGEETWEEKSSQ